MGQCVHAFTADIDARESAKHASGRLIGHFGCQIDHDLLHIELQAARA
jgi:hypothetical protein